jgi:hypothetical protein
MAVGGGKFNQVPEPDPKTAKNVCPIIRRWASSFHHSLSIALLIRVPKSREFRTLGKFLGFIV